MSITSWAPERVAPQSGPDLPQPRGHLTRWLFAHLRGERAGPRPAVIALADAGCDEDVQLALYCCYELHYRGFADVEPDLEWDPEVLALRRAMEAAFVDALPAIDDIGPVTPLEAEERLLAIASAGGGP